MRSIRQRLTVGFIVALGLSITLFGLILYFDRRQANLQELDARLEVEADFTLRIIREVSRTLGRLPPILESVQSSFQNLRHYLVLVGSRRGCWIGGNS